MFPETIFVVATTKFVVATTKFVVATTKFVVATYLCMYLGTYSYHTYVVLYYSQYVCMYRLLITTSLMMYRSATMVSSVERKKL